MKKTHSNTLLPTVEYVLTYSGISPSDIDLFSVAVGPGSFTGIRIGVATVKGLTFGRECPVCEVSTLEAMAYSTKDLVVVMEEESGVKTTSLRCDGGASANNFLMQFQSDVLGIDVDRPIEKESTALGAVYLCGMGLKIFDKEKLI